jgi:hypothetical protein
VRIPTKSPGSNYYAGLTLQSMIDLGADDAAKVSAFHSLWVSKAGANYYEAVRPYPVHRYFRPRGLSRLCLFPWHHRLGSPVPYKSLVDLRAAYMPDVAWAVSVHPPS